VRRALLVARAAALGTAAQVLLRLPVPDLRRLRARVARELAVRAWTAMLEERLVRIARGVAQP
jgi:hypothetical protein